MLILGTGCMHQTLEGGKGELGETTLEGVGRGVWGGLPPGFDSNTMSPVLALGSQYHHNGGDQMSNCTVYYNLFAHI